jgi:hypothetical protein
MNRIWANIEPVLYGVAAVLTIVFTWHQCADVTTPNGRFILEILLGFIAALLLLLSWREFRYSRRSRYAEIVLQLNGIFYEIQETARNPKATKEEIKATCNKVVNELSGALSLITGTRVSTCIKVMEGQRKPEPGARYKVVTLCRDDLSANQRNKKKVPDLWIDQNTAFEEVIESADSQIKCFFENYLPWKWGYKNSSFEVYGLPYSVSIPIIGPVIRDATWKLPYRSTIVAPITPLVQPTGHEEHVLSGYLCLDSRSKAIFRRRFDEDVVTGIANCLYNVVHRYCRLAWSGQA